MQLINQLKKIKFYAQKNFERYLNIFPAHRDQLEKLWLLNDQVYLRDQSIKNIIAGSHAKRNIILRWFLTSWCNYNCPYCNQSHVRKKTKHAFDIFSTKDWIWSFDNHFGNGKCNLLLTITGGEPLLDVKNMNIFLHEICTRDYLLNIRIDTNLSWPLSAYNNIGKREKIWLMCTFHPSQIEEEIFFDKIKEVQDAGFNIGICNYVVTNDSHSDYKRRMLNLLECGIPLHPNPLWNVEGKYDSESLALLQRYLPSKDYLYRTDSENTFGKKCLFPALAYEMNWGGAY